MWASANTALYMLISWSKTFFGKPSNRAFLKERSPCALHLLVILILRWLGEIGSCVGCRLNLMSSIPDRSRNTILLHHVHTLGLSHSICTLSLSPRKKWDYHNATTYFHVVSRLRMHGAINCPYTLSCCDACTQSLLCLYILIDYALPTAYSCA